MWHQRNRRLGKSSTPCHYFNNGGCKNNRDKCPFTHEKTSPCKNGLLCPVVLKNGSLCPNVHRLGPKTNKEPHRPWTDDNGREHSRVIGRRSENIREREYSKVHDTNHRDFNDSRFRVSSLEPGSTSSFCPNNSSVASPVPRANSTCKDTIYNESPEKESALNTELNT